MFERCFVEDGALAWPNGYELCPDLRARLEKKRRPAVTRGNRLRGYSVLAHLEIDTPGFRRAWSQGS